MVSRDERAVAALRSLNNPQSSVNVGYSRTAERLRAQNLAGLFERAGWSVSLNDTWQEQVRGYPVRYGVDVSGVNEYLLRQVVKTLVDAEFDEAIVDLQNNEIDPANPKYQWVTRAINVHVGHSKEDVAPRRSTAELAWARRGVIVGILGIFIPLAGAYLIAAGENAWWPFQVEASQPYDGPVPP